MIATGMQTFGLPDLATFQSHFVECIKTTDEPQKQCINFAPNGLKTRNFNDQSVKQKPSFFAPRIRQSKRLPWRAK